MSIPNSMCPSCLQTILLSRVDQYVPQIVPQTLLIHTSTLPSYSVLPPTNRISPSLQSVPLVCLSILIAQYIIVITT